MLSGADPKVPSLAQKKTIKNILRLLYFFFKKNIYIQKNTCSCYHVIIKLWPTQKLSHNITLPDTAPDIVNFSTKKICTENIFLLKNVRPQLTI